MKQRFFWILAMSMALSMYAVAKDHGDHGKGHGKDNDHKAQKHDYDDHHGWEARNGWEYRSYERGHLPPGWSKGKKVGWKECDLPPGQAKKYGCNLYRHEGRDYYWYRDEHERIIVRRPIVRVHAGVDIGF